MTRGEFFNTLRLKKLLSREGKQFFQSSPLPSLPVISSTERRTRQVLAPIRCIQPTYFSPGGRVKLPAQHRHGVHPFLRIRYNLQVPPGYGRCVSHRVLIRHNLRPGHGAHHRLTSVFEYFILFPRQSAVNVNAVFLRTGSLGHRNGVGPALPVHQGQRGIGRLRHHLPGKKRRPVPYLFCA